MGTRLCQSPGRERASRLAREMEVRAPAQRTTEAEKEQVEPTGTPRKAGDRLTATAAGRGLEERRLQPVAARRRRPASALTADGGPRCGRRLEPSPDA
eukprot:2216533-Prymnesium_polylepis.1